MCAHVFVHRFNNVTSLTLDAAAGVLYATDTLNHVIRVVTLGATAAATRVTTLAGGGPARFGSANNVADGAGANATFKWPMGIALVNITSGFMPLLPGGTWLLVSEAAGHRLRLVNVTDGSVRTLAGGSLGSLGFVDGVGIGALLYGPTGVVAVAPAPGGGDTTFAVVADSGNHALRRVASARATTFTLEARANGTADSVTTYNGAMYPFASWSVLRLPGGLAADVYDEMLFGDEYHVVSWCSYTGGGEGTLVLRGAMQAQLFRADNNGTSSTLLLTWQGVRATDVRVVPLSRFALPQDDPCSDSVPDGMRSYGSCVTVDASDQYAATLSATCTAADVNASNVSVLHVLPSGSGYSLDGPALHVSSDEYAFVGGMYPGETHVANVTLRRGGRYMVRAWGAVNVTLVGATDGVVLFSASLDGNTSVQQQQRIVAPALAGCMNPNAANYNPNALTDDGTCVAPGLPAQVSAYAAPGLPTPDTWFSFGVFSVGGAGDDDLATPVVPPQRFAAANQTAVLVPPLAPGLYYVEMYGNVSGTIQLFEPPDVPSALIVDAPGGLRTWDYTPVGSTIAAPLITFNASAVASGTYVPGMTSPTAAYRPDFVTPAVFSNPLFAWGVQFDAVPTNLDPYGTPLAGGAVRAYFAVPSRPSSHAFFTSPAGGAVAVPTAHVTAAAWVPPGALGPPGVSLRAAALTNLTATSAPPPSLGRLVSDIYALLPLDSTTPALTQPVTVMLPYDVMDADAVTSALGPYDAAAGVVVIGASDASGQDWHVLPNATFVNGLAVFSVASRGVFAVANSVMLVAALPPFASSYGGTRVLMAGMGIMPGRQAQCRFGADAGTFSAATRPPPPAAVGGFRATLACVVPALPMGMPPPLWVTLQFFSADALSTSAGAAVEGISTQTPMFLFASPPRVLAVTPARVIVPGGAVLHVTGQRLAPPASGWQFSGQPDAPAYAQPWMCGTSGFTLASSSGGGGASAPSSRTFMPATVVSSALALCEAPRASLPGDASLALGATGAYADVAPFPDGTPGTVTYAPAVTSATASAASSAKVTAHWGGDLLEVLIADAPSAQQTAFRVGTIVVAVRPGRAPHAVQAVAPAVPPNPGLDTVPFALTGLAMGEPDTAVDMLPAAGYLAVIAAAEATDVHPEVVFQPAGQDSTLTVVARSSADGGGDLPTSLLPPPTSLATLLCVLDGGPSRRVDSAARLMGAVTCPLPADSASAGGPVHALTLRIGSAAAVSDASGLRARSTLAPRAHILVLTPPSVVAVHPATIVSGGGTLLWVRGSRLRVSASHKAAVRTACAVSNRGLGETSTSAACAVSTAVMACEAPLGGKSGFQAVIYAVVYDTGTGAALARGLTRPGVDLGGQGMPSLQYAAPPLTSPLPDAGGALVIIRGAAHADGASSAELSCAFGTISRVSAAVRGGDTLACVAPAHAPSTAVALQLDTPGGWRSGVPPLAMLSFSSTPSAGPHVVASDASRVTVAVDANAASGALACLFDTASAPTVPQATQSGAVPWQLLTCVPPLSMLPLRFVALRVAPAAALSAFGLQQPVRVAGDGVAFEFNPPTPRVVATQPEVGPLWGGALLTISGSGFVRTGDAGGATACSFALPGAPAVDVPGAADSSTRVRCEAPASWPPAGADGLTGDVLVTVVVLTAGGYGRRAAFTAAALPPVTRLPRTVRAFPSVGDAAGGTPVDVAGVDFTTAGLPLQCQFGTIKAVAIVANATSMSCVSPASVPRRVPLAATPCATAATGLGSGQAPSFVFV